MLCLVQLAGFDGGFTFREIHSPSTRTVAQNWVRMVRWQHVFLGRLRVSSLQLPDKDRRGLKAELTVTGKVQQKGCSKYPVTDRTCKFRAGWEPGSSLRQSHHLCKPSWVLIEGQWRGNGVNQADRAVFQLPGPRSLLP